MSRPKLSASGISTFLSSPKAYYFRYVLNIEPISPHESSSPDSLAGSLFAEFTDAFYKGVPEKDNTQKLMNNWQEQTTGWVSKRTQESLGGALSAWAGMYHTLFSPDDGVRNGSEKLVENERFIGYVDGLSHDLILHELKTTSRAKSISEQLWKVQRSLQVRLYCVLTGAIGIRIEFCYKDAPYAIFRSEPLPVAPEQRAVWETELNMLADTIVGLGDNPNNYPCNTNGCNIFAKNYTSACAYQALCEYGYNETTKIAYQPRSRGRA